MPAQCPLQAVLGQVRERLKNDIAVASARRRMPGRRGHSLGCRSRAMLTSVEAPHAPAHQWYRLWPNGQGSGAKGPLDLEELLKIMPALCPLQTVLGRGASRVKAPMDDGSNGCFAESLHHEVLGKLIVCGQIPCERFEFERIGSALRIRGLVDI
jgi:hypothetical protein